MEEHDAIGFSHSKAWQEQIAWSIYSHGKVGWKWKEQEKSKEEEAKAEKEKKAQAKKKLRKESQLSLSWLLEKVK